MGWVFVVLDFVADRDTSLTNSLPRPTRTPLSFVCLFGRITVPWDDSSLSLRTSMLRLRRTMTRKRLLVLLPTITRPSRARIHPALAPLRTMSCSRSRLTSLVRPRLPARRSRAVVRLARERTRRGRLFWVGTWLRVYKGWRWQCVF